MKLRPLFVLLLLLAGVTHATETGRIQGVIIDETTAEPLIGANVVINDPDGRPAFGASTDLDGRYVLSVPAGTYDLEISFISFGTKTVTEVVVEPDGRAVVNATLAPELLQGEMIVVSAKADESSEVSMLALQKRAGIVTDGISSELMSQAASSDAGDALKRVTGVSVVGGKFVYVRGLGERYSNTQLNDAQLPSPEPNRRVVPMDMFPAGLLENIQIAKTFSPDQPGDFSGGSVQIKTREFPSALTMSFSAASGWNSQASLKDGLSYTGGDTDWLGVDDGVRALPEVVEVEAADQPIRERGRFSKTGFTSSEIQNFGRAFNNIWSPTVKTGPLNQSYSMSLGNSIGKPGGRELGFVSSFTYSNGYSLEEAQWNSYRTSGGELSPFTSYDVETSKNDVLWGVVFNTSYRAGQHHKLSVKTLYNRSAEDEARIYQGYNSDRSTDLRDLRLRFIERGIFSGQLSGEHHFESLSDSRLKWQFSGARATRNEPDNREVLYEQRRGEWVFFDITQSGSRFFFDLTDDEVGAKLDWETSVKSPTGSAGKIKFGGLVRDKSREFDARRFRFEQSSGIQRHVDLTGTPEELFAEENIAPGRFELRESTRSTDNYTATQDIHAGYLMTDMPLTGSLRFVGGVRVEKSKQNLVSFDPFALQRAPIEVNLDDTDVLPGVNLIYQLTDKQNLRASYSRTLARPDFRELAPFEFTDFVGGRAVIGDTTLTRTTIDNFDLRWEAFPTLGELYAVSVFSKRFTDPIEQIIQPTAQLRVSYKNAASAWNYGVEFEVRRQLDVLSPRLSSFSINGNVTLVRSEVDVASDIDVSTSSERSLQGQSPFVVNVNLGYQNPDRGTTATLLYNVFGKRISEVGAQGLPNVYEQPRHQLDLALKQQLVSRLKLKISAKNLLNHRTLYEQGSQVFRRYLSGRSVSLGVGYEL
jgi:outer membrane receptor protein involved in Fe transport